MKSVMGGFVDMVVEGVMVVRSWGIRRWFSADVLFLLSFILLPSDSSFPIFFLLFEHFPFNLLLPLLTDLQACLLPPFPTIFPSFFPL